MSNRYFEDARNTKSISGAQTCGLLAIAQAIENLAAAVKGEDTQTWASVARRTAEGPNGRYETSR